MAVPAKTNASAKPVPRIRTTAELAKHVGLSRATVSRILNGHAGIKPKNVERVMSVVERTGFTPNPYSNILRDQRSGTVAVCLSSFRHASVTQRLAWVVRRLKEAGYVALIESVDTTDHVGIQKWIRRMRAEGVIFVGQHRGEGLSGHVSELAAAGIPHVFTDDSGERAANTITVDRARGMELAANHLFDLGHARIGLLGIDGTLPVAVARIEGLRRAAQARGLNPERVIVHLAHPPERKSNMMFGREVAKRFAAEAERPTAYVALNDEIAFGAMEGFRVAGLNVPREVSVVGFDNAEISRAASPSITTIDPQTEPVAGAAVDFLLDQLRRDKPVTGRTRFIAPELLVRDSTGPAARP